MIIVDTALQQRLQQRDPIRVALVGAGYMGRGIALEILTAFPGMRLAAIVNRHTDQAERAYRDAGVDEFRSVSTAAELDAAIEAGVYAVSDDPEVVCRSGRIEAVIESTGDVEYGARVAFDAITHGKHVVLMNAEVDSTIGPILKVHADRNSVVYTYTDGDEPGVAMNLYRFVDSIGYKPVLMGQIKGFLNRYRNPETQREFASKHQQKAEMVASFADGSKLAIESTIIGNATGFRPGIRGMHGHQCGHVKDLLKLFGDKDFKDGGLVDFVLGAEPHTGAFVMGYNDHPVKQKYMSYFKMGDGPYYMFYTPYHLPHLQLPHSVARAVLFKDPTLTPRGAPVCDTVSIAKQNLRAGETLDGMGGFASFGLIDTYEVCQGEDYLPMPLSIGCKLLRDVPKDQPIRYADVVLPSGRVCDRLRAEQTAHFGKAQARVA
ncbi:MAG: Gfo/Idh/MocA family oxidoreductase [Steroidobacteraceae bacterium]|nr:Gfo/Idh/MocA family oxidoreductase [Steroidobacteraceae bacterium]